MDFLGGGFHYSMQLLQVSLPPQDLIKNPDWKENIL
ncbi:hypothetical protein BvCmsKKP042_04127 [Escherichia coli]|nr:hypothetical protein BvCmsKKP042_04127 [Escherichia coli]